MITAKLIARSATRPVRSPCSRPWLRSFPGRTSPRGRASGDAAAPLRRSGHPRSGSGAVRKPVRSACRELKTCSWVGEVALSDGTMIAAALCRSSSGAAQGSQEDAESPGRQEEAGCYRSGRTCRKGRRDARRRGDAAAPTQESPCRAQAGEAGRPTIEVTRPSRR